MHMKGVYQIITVVFLSFFALPAAFAQSVDGKNTTIDTTLSGDACGNTDSTNTNCTGANVPGPGDSRDVTNNYITVESSGRVEHTTTGGTYGGYTRGGGNVIGNTAEIIGYTGCVYGGYQENGNTAVVADNNIFVRNGGVVDINAYGGTVSGSMVGGVMVGGDVLNNTITIDSGGTVNANLFAGMTNGPGNMSGNTAYIAGEVKGSAYGGLIYNEGGEARENKIYVSGVVTGAFGGHSTGSGGVIDNVVTVESGGKVKQDVYAGSSVGSGDVIGNQAYIYGDVTRDVLGGYGYNDGNVRDNIVIVSGSVGRTVYSGYGVGNGEVSGNEATVENGGKVEGNYFGGNGKGKVFDNIATIQIGGEVVGNVLAGLGRGAGEVANNTANISGAVGEDVYGGYGSDGSSGLITGNTVNLYQGAAIEGDVYGGYAVTTSSCSISDNTVNLYHGAAITGGLFGGVSGGGGLVSGNTLNVNEFRGSVGEINGFHNYNFDLPLGIYAGETLINITGSTPTDLSGSYITVSNHFSPGAFTAIGDQIILIDQASGSFTANFSGVGFVGLSEVYDLKIHNDDDSLVIEAIGGTVINPQTKTLAYGLTSEIITLNRATDLITEVGIAQAMAALKKQNEGPAFFATTSYGNTRTKSGSHIDSHGWAGLMGLAWDEVTPDNTGWLASGFIEGGHGNWSAYNNFNGHGSVYSSGDTDYIGLGFLGHYRFKNRVRLEASARLGHVESDYRAKGYAGGLHPEFELSGMYYSAHLGVGYDLDLSDKLNLDMVGKYLWTLRKGETVSTVGEKISFDDINSHRVRAGGRLTYETDLGFQTYAGLYGEYEFDGESRSRNLSSDVRHKPAKIKGATGIGEIGVAITPAAINNFNIDLSVQGHAGRRDGFTGNAALSWMF